MAPAVGIISLSICILALFFLEQTCQVRAGKPFRQPTPGELQKGDSDSTTAANNLAQFENKLKSSGIYVQSSNPSLSMMAKFKKASPAALENTSKANLQVAMSKSLKSQLGLSKEQSCSDLKNVSLTESFKKKSCLPNPNCQSNYKYRTSDGSCNSKTIPNLGKALTTFRRIALPDYADGIYAPRVSSSGSNLTSARLISLIAFNGTSFPQPNFTLAVMQFGQFIAHDVQLTNQVSFGNGTKIADSSDIACCFANGSMIPPALSHPACFPIAVPVDDKFFNNGTVTTTCMNLVRSLTGPRLDCSLGYADQLNSNSHWLDGSTIYGSDNATTKLVRSFSKGELKMTYDPIKNRYYLPISPNCTSGACFFAGDQRVTEHPQLTVMHTIWAREHNRIAKVLASLNPKWNDETIFQETRRIVVAEVQHITYYEWLPTLLDMSTLTTFGLQSAKAVPTGNRDYKKLREGPTSNEFASAVFRFGHSTVQGTIALFNESGAQLPSSYTLSTFFNDASPLLNDPAFIDNALRGILFQPMQTVDDLVTGEMWNRLFRGTAKFGFDIVALNIQRGREHGLPGFNTYRQLCGLPKLTKFTDLISNPQVPGLLSQVYASVDDIDLFVGLVSELAPPGTALPATLRCLMADHFSGLKFTDNFYYEKTDGPYAFTTKQLAAIRQTSLSRIICDNSDGSIKSIQPSAFKPIGSTSNAKVLCSKLTSVDLSQWKQ